MSVGASLVWTSTVLMALIWMISQADAKIYSENCDNCRWANSEGECKWWEYNTESDSKVCEECSFKDPNELDERELDGVCDSERLGEARYIYSAVPQVPQCSADALEQLGVNATSLQPLQQTDASDKHFIVTLGSKFIVTCEDGYIPVLDTMNSSNPLVIECYNCTTLGTPCNWNITLPDELCRSDAENTTIVKAEVSEWYDVTGSVTGSGLLVPVSADIGSTSGSSISGLVIDEPTTNATILIGPQEDKTKLEIYIIAPLAGAVLVIIVVACLVFWRYQASKRRCGRHLVSATDTESSGCHDSESSSTLSSKTELSEPLLADQQDSLTTESQDVTERNDSGNWSMERKPVVNIFQINVPGNVQNLALTFRQSSVESQSPSVGDSAGIQLENMRVQGTPPPHAICSPPTTEDPQDTYCSIDDNTAGAHESGATATAANRHDSINSNPVCDHPIAGVSRENLTAGDNRDTNMSCDTAPEGRRGEDNQTASREDNQTASGEDNQTASGDDTARPKEETEPDSSMPTSTTASGHLGAVGGEHPSSSTSSSTTRSKQKAVTEQRSGAMFGRIADSGYGTVDLFTVNNSELRNRSNSSGTHPSHATREVTQTTDNRPPSRTTAMRDDALLAIPSQENLNNVVSGDLDPHDLDPADLEIANDITPIYPDETDNENCPQVISEQMYPRTDSTDSGESQEDNTADKEPSHKHSQSAIQSPQPTPQNLSALGNGDSRPMIQADNERPKYLLSNPLELQQDIFKSNDLSRNTATEDINGQSTKDLSDEQNLNVYSLSSNHRQGPVGNSHPVDHPSVTPQNLNCQTANNLYSTPVVTNNEEKDNDRSLELSDYNYDSIAEEKRAFNLQSHSRVDIEEAPDGFESLDRVLEAPQPLVNSTPPNFSSTRPKKQTVHRNDVNLHGPNSAPPQSHQSQSIPSQPEPLTQHPPRPPPQYGGPQYTYPHHDRNMPYYPHTAPTPGNYGWYPPYPHQHPPQGSCNPQYPPHSYPPQQPTSGGGITLNVGEVGKISSRAETNIEADPSALNEINPHIIAAIQASQAPVVVNAERVGEVESLSSSRLHVPSQHR